MFTKGQIVFSKAGRDKGMPFIIVWVDNDKNLVGVVDGDIRKFASPKKKNFKHIQPTNDIHNELAEIIINNGYIQDAMFRRALLPYKDKF